MAAQRDPSTSVHPRVQAARMEMAARGEFLARAVRDVDLVEAGVAPETLALVGGPSIRTLRQAWPVAVWLWSEAERAELNRPATVLYNAMAHNAYPPPRNGEERGWHFPARTRAGMALSRRLLSFAVDAAGSHGAPKDDPTPHELSGVLGEWWASMIEGAGLSEEAATLYRVRNAVRKQLKGSPRDLALMYRHARQSAESPEPEAPETPSRNRAQNASAETPVSYVTPHPETR